MNAPQTTPVLCPSREELSLSVDGGGDAAVREHLQRCEVCRRVVQAYQRLDAAVGAASAPPAYLAERIKIRCRNLPVEKPNLLGGWWSLLRYPAVAAVVVLVGWGVVSAVSSGLRSNGQAPAVAQAPDTTATGTDPVVAPAAPVEALAAAPAETVPAAPEAKTAGPEVPVAANDLRMVNLSGQGTNPAAISETRSGLALPLPLRTRHVWVVRDPAQSEKLLEQALPANAQCERLGTGNETVDLRMVLPDRTVQQLVDRLAASGWSLMTPSVPQPGRSRDVLLSGRPVVYDVRLVSGR